MKEDGNQWEERGKTAVQVYGETGIEDKRWGQRVSEQKDRETENRRSWRALAVCERNEERLWGFTSRCEARWRTTKNTVPDNRRS